ncbi:MAG: GNAT family N-acetyltransferase [Flavobacterium sp.]|nr:MAG: GNAT family N-acetyltransferase [Flavobacterium sp.]
MQILTLQKKHYSQVAKIYKEGLDTGVATFETAVPDWDSWDKKFLAHGRFVIEENHEVMAWCALSSTSPRAVYKGVVENTIYVAAAHKRKGLGRKLLEHLIEFSEKEGYYTLQAAIFPQNRASIKLHKDCGFRVLGIREKIAQRDGVWHDNVLMERRSKKVNYLKNILVLCTGNSCRSQIAHGYLNSMAKGKAQIYSAGIETHGLNPNAVSIMAEDGIDISPYTSNHVEEYTDISWDYILTVCDHALENCPIIKTPNALRLHQNFSDPSKVKGSEAEMHAAFLKTRNEIKEYCRKFIETNL